MRKKLLLITLFCSIIISACKKDGQESNTLTTTKLTDIKVPEGFTWESSRDVNFKINVPDSYGIEVISIYGPDGKLLSKGAASVSAAFKTRIYLPNTMQEVYLVKTSADNSTVSQKVEVKSTEIEYTFGNPATSVISRKNAFGVLSASPDCSTGCDQSITLNQNGQWITVDAGKTVCVSGSGKTFNVTFGTGGGSLRICGTSLTLQNINKNSGNSAVDITITSNSIVNFPALELDKSVHTLNNYGNLTFTGNLSTSGLVKNYGILTINSDYNLNSANNLIHTNEGTLVVKGSMNTNSSTVFNNSGTAQLKKLQVNSSSTFNNYCKLSISENLIVDKTLNNYSYAEVGTITQINANGLVNLYNGAYFKTNNLDKISGFFVGNGSASLLKITGSVNQNLILDANQTSTGQKIKGSIELCYGSVLPAGLFKDGATQGCDLYIASSGCNPGNGQATVADSDGDGINDNLDDYPNDASKAFNNYYPYASADAGATVAFEDMWPVKGDYDMNDVVLSYRLQIVSNALNKVVGVEGTYDLYARGGIYQNGFGIEFPVSRSNVSNVSGGTLEEGQQKAVIILFSNMQSELYYMNTRRNEPLSPSKSYTISFDITNGPDLNDFGLGEYNPFIWNKAAGRGYEIHLPGRTPTSLANTALFGTGDDRSNPSGGKYYVTEEGYPWAISIPVKSFSYPVEGADISTAYLKLPYWISSGGTSYSDWYMAQQSGYINPENIFTK